jgi:uncharacterized membrane protein
MCVSQKSSSFGFVTMALIWVAKNQMCLIGVGIALQTTVKNMTSSQ